MGGFLHGDLVPALRNMLGLSGTEAVGYYWSAWLLDNPRFLMSALNILTPLKPFG